MNELFREGYGSAFNTLYIRDDTFIKKAKNEYGQFRLKNEKEFLKFLLTKKINFPIPEKLSFYEEYYTMKYYKDWKPLYKVLQEEATLQTFFVEKVYHSLGELHNSSSKLIERDLVRKDLIKEMVWKLRERSGDIEDLIKDYNHIKTVNGLELVSMSSLFELFEEEIDRFLKDRSTVPYVPIHGDCQFNNILVSPKNDSIVFIDPRGYFGLSSIYGLKEYDHAKVQFALSGYDVFDNSEITFLDISGSNLYLPNIAFEPSSLGGTSFVSLLTASIWLGNPHCFKHKPLKAVYSYFYGLYFATLVYNACRSGTR